MLVGFNSLLYKDISPVQRICYLTAINLSPTSLTVVQETMRQSLKIAKDCGEQYMQVTYDLAIAKVALQIQNIESPEFDDLFIHLGIFNVMLAYFKAVGKYIDGCGITNIMVDSDMLANGSVNGLITGKNFNRCKKL